MELTIGKWNNTDLAKWFGISSRTFSNVKQKKLEELKLYAKFFEDKGKIIITEVLNPVYSKNTEKNYKKVRDKIDEVWSADGLDTCARVGDEIFEILSDEEEDFNLKNTTVVNYTRKGRNELYGKPFIGGGKLGDCVYVWCKKNEETGLYEKLNKEESKIKEELQVKYFGDTTEKQVLVKGMIASGEISEEEAWGVLEEMTNMNDGNFMRFLMELRDRIGCQVVKGTLVERKEASAFIESK